MKILLSIKPEFADKILSGKKRFEFRKAAFANIQPTCIVIYATQPVGKVVGEFDVAHIFVDDPENIWKKTKQYAGIEKKRYDEYYNGKNKAVALGVGEVRKYDSPFSLNEFSGGVSAPQSFMYLDKVKNEAQMILV